MHSVPRLIEQFIPNHYQLSLTLRRAERTFEGLVTIHGIAQTSGAILVHAKDLDITSATIDGKEAKFTVQKDDTVSVTHPDIALGKHILVIAFGGKITDGMHGLYPCYFDHDGTKKELLATQFESHHAREVFPCIDEPEAKATFDLTLTTELGIIVLSNMPTKNQTTENDQLVTTFETTPRMSTYLLAWVAGELHRKTAKTKDGVEVNVWATLAQPAQSLDFALDHAIKSIEFFNDYFGVPYPLPKSDHVALPDFTAGAMENWGLITYREIALLADPMTSSVSTKQYIALVIAHEVSHQWFGNLVTMKWWNDLWLNESFATLMEYVALDAMHPEWNTWLDFSTHETISALRRDSIDGVQPVQVEVHHPDEITTIFDPAIVYAKGARLLRMLERYIGSEAFRAGLHSYFTIYAYKNTVGEDLWNELGKASGKDIADFMNQWITQPGYPVVKVRQEGSTVKLEQKRFFIGPHQPSDSLWPIPLQSPDLPQLFAEREATISVLDKINTVHLNNGDTSHYVTQYSAELLQNHIQKIDIFSPLERLQLLNEQTLLARSGAVSSATLIPTLQAYQHESTEAVWGIIALAIGELKKFAETSPTSETKLRQLATSLAKQQYDKLGWQPQPKESETDAKLRATIIGMMVYGEDTKVIAKAKEQFNTTPLEDLNPELRSLVIGAAVRHSNDPDLISKLLEKYKASASADMRDDIADGLTYARKSEDVKKLLEAIRTIVRPQDVRHWFVWLIRNKDSRNLTWKWLRDNWDWITKTFGGDKSYDDFPKYAASAMVTRQQLEEYKAFFTPLKKERALTRVITLGIREIEGRVELIERDSDDVQKALTEL